MNIEANKVIGRQLRKLRRQAGLTQLQLSEKINKPQSYVSKVETGERGLYLYEAIDYAAALGKPIESIIEELAALLK